MTTLTEVFTDPVAITAYATFGAVILAKIVWPYLEKYVKGTASLTDDQFLASIEDMVNTALAKKTKPKVATTDTNTTTSN